MNNICHLRHYFLPVFATLTLLGFSPGSGSKHMAIPKNIDFNPFTENIKGSQVSFDMIPIAGGSFSMGSPETEPGRKGDEGPVHEVSVDSFWIGKMEVTWDEFELFVFDSWEKNLKAADKNEQVDAVTRPSPPFVDMSFGMGKNGYPAINMTQFAALGYCRWLTAKTGHFYRLPTEAEWEYACRAGARTAYSFGDNPDTLGEYAWYGKNSQEKYHKPGTKKANRWGLYDMHGNVAEWTLDQYIADYYTGFAGKKAANPWAVPSTLYPRSVRGGSWEDEPESLRSAARLGSSARWKQRDPQIPKSDWWNTDASFVGFRVVRPLNQPSADLVRQYFAAQPADN